MKDMFERMNSAIRHLQILNELFLKKENFKTIEEKRDYQVYFENEKKLTRLMGKLNFHSQLYGPKDRQMILADLFEYILLGRGYYSIELKKDREDKERFTRLILHFVNLLMCYEMMTVSNNVRRKALIELGKDIGEITVEKYYDELKNFDGTVGLKKEESEAPKYLNRYFDSILPKTAGGLWHELLVYIFLLRNDVGYIIPLLLSQRLFSLEDRILPPDFLVISHDKRIYGIEVGRKKEIQSGSFSLKTAIPTATIDTINSRTSDRCPICKRWIPFCSFVIDNYSNFDKQIDEYEIKCIEKCDKFSNKVDITEGKCKYTKYSKEKKRRLRYTHHKFATGLHYHYKCVLENLPERTRKKIISAKDTTALKTHYPYYSGLEELIRNVE